MDHLCAICEAPCEDSAFVDKRCAEAVARFLADAVALSGEVEATVALQARYGSSGALRAAVPAPVATDEAARPSQRAETFGWAASRELPVRGALRPTRLPFNERAAERAAAAFNALTTWARVVEGDRGTPIPAPQRGEHPAAAAAAYLLEHLDWCRRQRWAAECLADLRSAGGAIRQIVDSPPETILAGVCECGTRLYAYARATTVTCLNCGSTWDVETSRQNMWDILPSYYFTAAEAAWLLVLHGIPNLGNPDGYPNLRRWAKTITAWGSRGHLTTGGEVEGEVEGKTEPIYLFGDILDRATRKGVAA